MAPRLQQLAPALDDLRPGQALPLALADLEQARLRHQRHGRLDRVLAAAALTARPISGGRLRGPRERRVDDRARRPGGQREAGGGHGARSGAR